MKYAIDRLNDNFALCQDIETGEFKEIPIELLEAGTKEGDIIFLNDGKYIKDAQLEAERRKSLRQRLDKLIKRKDEGDN